MDSNQLKVIGYEPLWNGIGKNHFCDFLKCFLEKIGDPNLKGTCEETPLYMAV